jgi:hypothetical protein
LEESISIDIGPVFDGNYFAPLCLSLSSKYGGIRAIYHPTPFPLIEERAGLKGVVFFLFISL